jgi:hypothetical protein
MYRVSLFFKYRRLPEKNPAAIATGQLGRKTAAS